jgi:hypothetical protein
MHVYVRTDGVYDACIYVVARVLLFVDACECFKLCNIDPGVCIA